MNHHRHFTLGVFAYPGGDMYCNTAVMANGDYKQIAFIDNTGNLRFEVSKRYLPDGMEQEIMDAARKKRNDFFEWWNKQPKMYRYGHLLEKATSNQLLMAKEQPLESAIQLLEKEILGADIVITYCKGGEK